MTTMQAALHSLDCILRCDALFKKINHFIAREQARNKHLAAQLEDCMSRVLRQAAKGEIPPATLVAKVGHYKQLCPVYTARLNERCETIERCKDLLHVYLRTHEECVLQHVEQTLKILDKPIIDDALLEGAKDVGFQEFMKVIQTPV